MKNSFSEGNGEKSKSVNSAKDIYCFLSSPDRVRKHLQSIFRAIGNNFTVWGFRGLSLGDLIFCEKEKLFLYMHLMVFHKYSGVGGYKRNRNILNGHQNITWMKNVTQNLKLK